MTATTGPDTAVGPQAPPQVWHDHDGIAVRTVGDDTYVEAFIARGRHDPAAVLAVFEAHATRVLGWPSLACDLPVSGDLAGMVRHTWARRIPTIGASIWDELADDGGLCLDASPLDVDPPSFEVTVLEPGHIPTPQEEQ